MYWDFNEEYLGNPQQIQRNCTPFVHRLKSLNSDQFCSVFSPYQGILILDDSFLETVLKTLGSVARAHARSGRSIEQELNFGTVSKSIKTTYK